MKRPNPYRNTRTFTLPKSLVDRLESESKRIGVPTERLVEQIIVQQFPALLADIATSFLVGSIERANRFDASTENQMT